MTTAPLDFHDAYERTMKLARRRHDLIEQYEQAVRAAADKQQDYRRALAMAHVSAAADSDYTTAAARETRAKDLASDAERDAAIADGMVKATQERLRAVEADRAMLNALMGWSQRLNAVGVE